MRTFFKTPLRKSLAIIATVVDVYSLIQIFKQTSFKMPDLLTSPWFWLFILVSATCAVLFFYFKHQDDKKNNAAYRKGVTDEFYKRMEEENKLHARCNKLGWQIEELKSQIEVLKNARETYASN